jgi:hypothetical protein
VKKYKQHTQMQLHWNTSWITRTQWYNRIDLSEGSFRVRKELMLKHRIQMEKWYEGFRNCDL